MDPYAVATSCVWVATKGCEELQLRLRDLVNVVHRALNPDSKPLALDDDYYDLRNALIFVLVLVLYNMDSVVHTVYSKIIIICKCK